MSVRPRHHEVGAQREVRAVDQEVLLLGAQRGEDALHALVAEQLEQLDRLRRRARRELRSSGVISSSASPL